LLRAVNLSALLSTSTDTYEAPGWFPGLVNRGILKSGQPRNYPLNQATLGRMLMPFVNISLARGKSNDYVRAVSRAVHDALVAEFHVNPEDDFQVIYQHEAGEMVFNRNFRGGPRSDDWIVVTITDVLDHGELAKRRFYKALVRLLQEGPRIRPADVFIMVNVTPPENLSFADGIPVTDVTAAEALEESAKSPGSRAAYTKAEMTYAITELLGRRDSSRILPMLRQDFILKIPATLPYGGEFIGPDAFANFFAQTPGGAEVWESFNVQIEQVIGSADYLVAQLTNTAVLKATGKTVIFQNAWLFEAASGRLVSAQLYADTAAARSSAG
jgi:ketosteroid isomerase-like protein